MRTHQIRRSPIATPIVLLLAALASPTVAAAWFLDAGGGRAAHDGSGLEADAGFLRFGAGHRFGEHFAVEAAVVDFADASDRVGPPEQIALAQDRLETAGTGVTLAPVVAVRPHQRLELSARLGVAAIDVERRWSGGTVIDPARVADNGGTDTSLFGGLRLALRLNNAFEIALAWDRYALDDIDTDAVHAGLRYNFGGH